MSNHIYYKKYLKYRFKYLNLKGGALLKDEDIIYQSFIELYSKLFYVPDDKKPEWDKINRRTAYLRIFSNILINKKFTEDSRLEDVHINNQIKQYIKATLDKKKTFKSAHIETNAKSIFVDCHGSYSRHISKLPDNVILCTLSPVNRFSSNLSIDSIKDIIFNSENQEEYFRKGLSCFEKNNLNDECFQYMQVFYDLYPNLILNLELKPDSILYDKTGVYLNPSSDRLNLLLNEYDHKVSTNFNRIYLNEVIDIISKKYPDQKNIIFLNTCRNIDYSLLGTNYHMYNNFLNSIYIFEKILSLLNYFIDNCDKNTKLIKKEPNCKISFNKFTETGIRSINGYQFLPEKKRELLEFIKFKDMMLSPDFNNFWLYILSFFNSSGELINPDFDINGKYFGYKNLLTLAVENNFTKIVRLLLSNGIEIDPNDYSMIANMDKAIENNNFHIINLLSEFGLKITRNNIIKYIDILFKHNEIKTIIDLINSGYYHYMGSKTKAPFYALEKEEIIKLAIKYKNKDIIDLLYETGFRYQNILHKLTKDNNIGLMEYLLNKYKLDINLLNENGKNPYSYAETDEMKAFIVKKEGITIMFEDYFIYNPPVQTKMIEKIHFLNEDYLLASYGNTLIFMNITNKETKLFNDIGNLLDIHISEKILIATSNSKNNIFIFELRFNNLDDISLIKINDLFTDKLRFFSNSKFIDNKQLLLCDMTNLIVINIYNNAIIYQSDPNYKINTCTVSVDGKYIAFVQKHKDYKWKEGSNYVILIEIKTKTIVTDYELEKSEVDGMTFSNNNDILAVSVQPPSHGNDILLLKLNPKFELVEHVEKANKGWIYRLFFSPDDKLFMTSSTEETIVSQYIDKKLKKISKLEIDKSDRDYNRAVAFSLDNKFIALGTDQGKIYIWEIK